MEEDYISKKDQDLLPASVSLVSTKDRDVLSMAVVQMSNSGFFIAYGKVFEENKYFIENFRIK